MNRISLEFESPDAARWLWVAVAVLAAVELGRYVIAGRRPASALSRAVICALAGAGVAGMAAAGIVRFDPGHHAWACMGLGILVCAWLVRSYRRTTREIPRRVRVGLLALRLSAAVVVVLALLQPVLQSVRTSRHRAVLGIVLDDSRSMTVRDVVQKDGEVPTGRMPVPQSRLEAVQQTLRGERSLISQAESGLDVKWFQFAGDAREVKSPDLSGEGAATALADAVLRANESCGASGRTVAGVIVVSDGRDNFSAHADPAAVGEALAAAGVPLYAFGVGSDVPAGQTRDLQARRMDCPARVAVMNRLPVHAEFFASGLAGTDVEVELLDADKIVERRRLRASKAAELLAADFVYTPAEPGLHRLTVRARTVESAGETPAPQQRKEASLSQFVQVTDDQVRVLYLDRARYERAAIVRALEASKDLRVTKMDVNRGSDATASRPAEVDTRAFDAVLIGDVERAAFSDSALRSLRDLVMVQGRGVAMLGGVRTLGSGQYRRTVLDEVLPVGLDVNGEWPGPLPFELTAAGRGHAICQLGADAAASEAAWKQLPPFASASRLGEPKPAAEVLMRTAAGEPLLVVQEAGKGRSAVVAFDSTWQWSFAVPTADTAVAHGDQKGVEAQRRFWRQLVLWLANRRSQVWVSASRSRYALARLRSGVEEIVLRAGVSEPTSAGQNENVAMSGQLIRLARQRGDRDAAPVEIPWTRTPDGFEARPHVDEAGEYRVKVSAKSSGAAVGEAETAFAVEAADVELTDPMADPEMLKRMAARTSRLGGGYFPLEQFGEVLERIRSTTQVSEITHVQRAHLIDDYAWGWFGLFVLLVGVEWLVRRRAGLV